MEDRDPNNREQNRDRDLECAANLIILALHLVARDSSRAPILEGLLDALRAIDDASTESATTPETQ